MSDKKQEKTVFPKPLRKGDLIVICSPAGPIAEEKVYGARDVLEDQGWRVRIAPHTLGKWGNYSGTDQERYDDLEAALLDPEVRAIICSRGGYGVVHLMERLSKLDLKKDPKWIVGFSDISALHALMASNNISSVHASMAAHIMKGAKDPDNAALFNILSGVREAVSFPASSYDRPGIATGRLIGGNLAVLADLIDTRFDVFRPDTGSAAQPRRPDCGPVHRVQGRQLVQDDGADGERHGGSLQLPRGLPGSHRARRPQHTRHRKRQGDAEGHYHRRKLPHLLGLRAKNEFQQ